jgi:hypothetical protein
MGSAASKRSPSHRSEQLCLPAERPLCLVVVADTHSAMHPDSVRYIEAQRPDAILHAGDIGALDVVDRLGAIAPTIAIRGNIDSRLPELPDSTDIAVEQDGAPLLRILLLHIGVYGARLRADAARQARALEANMVVCGHSHVPFIGRDRGLIVFNPGSIGPRRFQLPITFGVIDIAPGGIDLRHISCETGTSWSP